MEEGTAADDVVTDFACFEVADEERFAGGVNAKFAGAAVVVDLVAAVRAEEVLGRVGAEGIAVGVERGAVGPDDIVVDEGVAVGPAKRRVQSGAKLCWRRAPALKVSKVLGLDQGWKPSITDG